MVVDKLTLNFEDLSALGRETVNYKNPDV